MSIEDEDVVTYIFIPDVGFYGTVISLGAWASIVEYYEDGFSYTLELPNDEFIVINEIGVGYLDETEGDL